MVFNTIMESRVMHLLVFVEKKATTVKQLFEGKISEAFPASDLKEHPNVIVIANEATLGEITLI